LRLLNLVLRGFGWSDASAAACSAWSIAAWVRTLGLGG
jgi:hypothetical protein